MTEDRMRAVSFVLALLCMALMPVVLCLGVAVLVR
jgi:hypothetical protein